MIWLKRAVRGAAAAVTRAARVAPYHAPIPAINRWAADARPARRTAFGVRFDLDPTEHIQRYIYWSGGYEIGFTREFLRALPEGGVLVDVGANVGWYSLTAAKRVGPRGRVLAVEPVETNAARIRRNADLNGFANVQVEVLALAEKAGELLLHAPRDDNEGTYSVTSVDADPARRVAVRATTLDDVARGLPRLDVLKIDVQGAELGVLQGARETLARFSPLVFCEIHPRHLREIPATPEDAVTLLATAGYEPGEWLDGAFRARAPDFSDGRERMVVFAKRPRAAR